MVNNYNKHSVLVDSLPTEVILKAILACPVLDTSLKSVYVLHGSP